MGLATPGIGSGLDINAIVTQLVAIEKLPLQGLQTKAQSLQTQLSMLSQVQNQISALADSAAKLASAGSWAGMTLSSSSPGVVNARSNTSASTGASTLNVQIQALASARSAVTQTGMASTANFGTGGVLTLQMGSRAPYVNGVRVEGEFSASSTIPAVNIAISSTDTLASVASKINAANVSSSAGVGATVIRDASGYRLLLRSNQTGVDADFQISSTGDASLSAFEFNPSVASASAMVSGAAQQPRDAQFTIDGVALNSASNTLADSVPGMTLELLQTSSTGVKIASNPDVAAQRAQLEGFVKAYNSLNKTLSDVTRYDPGSRVAGVFQGDSAMVGLQNALRSLLGVSGGASTFRNLSALGLQLQKDGSLLASSTPFDAALLKPDELQKFFVGVAGDSQNPGFALKLKNFAQGVLAHNGQVTNKTASLKTMSASNSREQERINERAAAAELRLKKQYSALDANLGRLQALNSYVAQQVTTWNKSTS